MRRPIVVGALVALFCVSCTSHSASEPAATNTSSSTVVGTASPATSSASPSSPTNYAHSSVWLDVGRQISLSRGDTKAKHRLPPLLSAPVDVLAPGTYELVAGPVPKAVGKSYSLGLTLPPDVRDHFVFDNNPLVGLSFIQRGSGRYLDAHLVVSTVTSPYYGLTVWFQ
jgi:hypothetical protein